MSKATQEHPFFIKLLAWVTISVAFTVLPISWRPIVGDGSLADSYQHGELAVVAIAICAGAVGYAPFVEVTGKVKNLKWLVFFPGLALLFLITIVYVATIDLVDFGKTRQIPSHAEIAHRSYIAFIASFILGVCTLYLQHAADREARRPNEGSPEPAPPSGAPNAPQGFASAVPPVGAPAVPASGVPTAPPPVTPNGPTGFVPFASPSVAPATPPSGTPNDPLWASKSESRP